MVMGIVIYMAKRESANFHSVPTTLNPMASVSNTAIKRKKCSNNGCTNNAVRNGVCISHGAKRYCTIPGCAMPLYQAQSADLTSGVFRWRKLNLTQQGRTFREQQK